MEFFAKQTESLELDIQWPLILGQPLIPWDLPNQCNTRQALRWFLFTVCAEFL